jgi:hypothetical protein
MRSEDVTFTKGPLHGRTLPVFLGLNGRPPKTYEVPVPHPAGGPPTVHLYRLQATELSPRMGLPRRWGYVYDPEGGAPDGRRRPWPRSRKRHRKADSEEGGSGREGAHKDDIPP